MVLLASGPVDRDMTTGPNKPFKDLAWGLASRGAAVLRFDKVTYVHGQGWPVSPGSPMADEYVPDAIAAVRLLQRQPGRGPGAGFSSSVTACGGKVAPRVAAAEPSVAGLVIMAGGHGAAERFRRPGAGTWPG